MRSLQLLALTGCLVLGGVAPAWAHGEVEPDQVAPGSTSDLFLFLPSERASARTSKVVLAFPAGFTARACERPVGWDCSVAADAIEWRDIASVQAESRFVFTLTASSTSGTYTLPVEQTYDDGTVNVFAGAPGEADEAPVLRVGAAAPSPAASSARPSSVTPSSSTGPTTAPPSATARPSAASPTPAAAPSATRATATATPSATATFERPTTLPQGELVEAAPESASEERAVPVAVAVVALVGAGLAVALVARRRRS